MIKRCSVCQGANCSHAQYYFAVLDFRGIAISKTVYLTLLIILKQIHSTVCIHIDVYVCEISLKSHYYKYAKHLNKKFCVHVALQCIGPTTTMKINTFLRKIVMRHILSTYLYSKNKIRLLMH